MIRESRRGFIKSRSCLINAHFRISNCSTGSGIYFDMYMGFQKTPVYALSNDIELSMMHLESEVICCARKLEEGEAGVQVDQM